MPRWVMRRWRRWVREGRVGGWGREGVGGGVGLALRLEMELFWGEGAGGLSVRGDGRGRWRGRGRVVWFAIVYGMVFGF